MNQQNSFLLMIYNEKNKETCPDAKHATEFLASNHIWHHLIEIDPNQKPKDIEIILSYLHYAKKYPVAILGVTEADDEILEASRRCKNRKIYCLFSDKVYNPNRFKKIRNVTKLDYMSTGFLRHQMEKRGMSKSINILIVAEEPSAKDSGFFEAYLRELQHIEMSQAAESGG